MDLIPSPSEKFKFLAWKFTWGNKAKHCWVMSTNFLFSKVFWQVDNAQQCLAFTPQANFPTHNLNFHWRWRWWDRIQDTFWNLFYFTYIFGFRSENSKTTSAVVQTIHIAFLSAFEKVNNLGQLCSFWVLRTAYSQSTAKNAMSLIAACEIFFPYVSM